MKDAPLSGSGEVKGQGSDARSEEPLLFRCQVGGAYTGGRVEEHRVLDLCEQLRLLPVAEHVLSFMHLPVQPALSPQFCNER